MAKMAGLHADDSNHEEFSLLEVNRLFNEGKITKLFDYIATEYHRRGQEQEQERIIKLLEEARNKCACYREVGMPICRHQLSVDEQVAFIKGENK
jgi:hypothetical protein